MEQKSKKKRKKENEYITLREHKEGVKILRIYVKNSKFFHGYHDGTTTKPKNYYY